jgi:hypothetical protein
LLRAPLKILLSSAGPVTILLLVQAGGIFGVLMDDQNTVKQSGEGESPEGACTLCGLIITSLAPTSVLFLTAHSGTHLLILALALQAWQIIPITINAKGR